jgi:hypothetical protein
LAFSENEADFLLILYNLGSRLICANLNQEFVPSPKLNLMELALNSWHLILKLQFYQVIVIIAFKTGSLISSYDVHETGISFAICPLKFKISSLNRRMQSRSPEIERSRA